MSKGGGEKLCRNLWQNKTRKWSGSTWCHQWPALTHTRTMAAEINKLSCYDQPVTHRFLMFLPTVIVCCHGDAGIAHAGLLGEGHLGHSGHVDDVSAPLSEHQALGSRGKAGPLDSQHGPSHVTLNAQTPRHLHQNLHQGSRASKCLHSANWKRSRWLFTGFE